MLRRRRSSPPASNPSSDTASQAVRPLSLRHRRPLPQPAWIAVITRAPSNKKVLARCIAPTTPRAIEVLPATSSNSTKPAPTSASMMTKTPAATDDLRTGCPDGKMRQPHTIRTITKIIASPLLRRCTNSIVVAGLSVAGMTTPLHKGQWLPQPAPEPVALTTAPQRITPMLSARVTHANLTYRPLLSGFMMRWPLILSEPP